MDFLSIVFVIMGLILLFSFKLVELLFMLMYIFIGLGFFLIIIGVVFGFSDEVLDMLLFVFWCLNLGVFIVSAFVFRSIDNLFLFIGFKGEW